LGNILFRNFHNGIIVPGCGKGTASKGWIPHGSASYPVEPIHFFLPAKILPLPVGLFLLTFAEAANCPDCICKGKFYLSGSSALLAMDQSVRIYVFLLTG
jgi:hypothetical protein